MEMNIIVKVIRRVIIIGKGKEITILCKNIIEFKPLSLVN